MNWKQISPPRDCRSSQPWKVGESHPGGSDPNATYQMSTQPSSGEITSSYISLFQQVSDVMCDIQSKITMHVRSQDKTNKNQEKQQTLETDSWRLRVRELLNFKITVLHMLKYIKDKRQSWK